MFCDPAAPALAGRSKGEAVAKFERPDAAFLDGGPELAGRPGGRGHCEFL
jgi:hypothetical protein